MTDTPEPIQPAPLTMTDPNTGSVMPFPPEAQADVPPITLLSQYREDHPELAHMDDYVVARGLYDHGVARDKESFPEFATRIGVVQSAPNTLLGTAGSSLGLHLNEPLESTIAGLAAMLHGGQFGEGYTKQHQEIADRTDVGRFQNPKSNLAGNIGGTAASYVAMNPLLSRGVHALGEAVPTLERMVNSPMGSSILKMIGLSEGEQIPKTVENQALRTDEPSVMDRVGEVTGDLGKAGAEGAGSAVLGQWAAQGLSQLLGPLGQAAGNGLRSWDSTMKGLPRANYTKAANNLSEGYTGSPTPAQQGAGIDYGYYDGLLKRGGLDEKKALAQLEGILSERGPPTPKSPHDIVDSVEPEPAPLEKIDLDTSLHPDLHAGINDTGMPPPGGPSRFDPKTPPPTPDDKQLLSDELDRILASRPDPSAYERITDNLDNMRENDPSGKEGKDYLASVYQKLMLDRLRTGGPTIQPPFRGVTGLSQQYFERTGGGPGRSAGWIPTGQSALGWSNMLLNLPSVAAANTLGRGLDVGGLGTTLAGEPGTGAVRLLSHAGATDTAKALDGFVQQAPYAWQAGMQPYLTGQLHGDDPIPAHDAAWLGQADRPTALAYIGSRLGPQAAQQLQETDDQGYKMGLYQLMADPNSRKALFR